MIYNVWIRALSESLESICLGSWELKRDLNTLPLHVRHGVWNHGPLEWCHNESAMAPEITGVSIVCLAVRSTLRVSGLCEGKSTTSWRHHATRTTYCLFSWFFRPSTNETSKFAFVVLCEGNTRVSSGFSLQRASDMKRFWMSWRHHGWKN